MLSETRHRMTRRLAQWDYAQKAIYSIVLTLADRSRGWLGRLEKRECAKRECAKRECAKNGAPQDSSPRMASHRTTPQDWRIEPTAYGQAVLEALDVMPRLYPQVRILARQLMPEHFHFVAYVQAPLPKPFGELVRGFKAGAAKRWRELAKNGEPQNCAKNGEPQNCAPRGCSVAGHSCPAWSEGFQDTVLLHEGQLAAMIAYVRDNPRRLAMRRANPELFRRIARISLPLDGGRMTGQFESLGNRFLIERPLFQVQCSRRFFAYRRIPKRGGGMKIIREAEISTAEFAAIRDDALVAAEHGAVIISPCISDGEREIACEALERGLPLVTLRNKGFSKLEKPSGRLFEACIEGRLLMLAPAAWPYTTAEKPMTRLDATALNRITQWLCGESAIEIDCKGMTPANIDRLAMEAVQG
ncbi:MAG: hypothetical protein J6P13_07855 [Kiritimatiellae bacterium]|nr:hypothetical protein [Kiritimatiellia bacterium]